MAMMTLLPLTMTAQRIQQTLGRGVVAVNRTGGRSVTSTGGQGNLISWRKLAQDADGTTYNVYRRNAGASDFTKMTAKPLTVTNYVPTSLVNNAEYAVTAISPDGVEGPMSQPFLYKSQPWPNVWFNFDFDNKVITRNDYRTKFVWPMDLDGDGEYDAVVADRLYAATVDNDDAENMSDNTATTTHKIQAYKLDGTLLWTVDMGPNVNICGGQNDMVVAYDINCDGQCEVIIRSSDGTRFWDKTNETWGLYANHSIKADVDGDGIVDYRTQNVKNPPFYMSVINGATGEEIDCNELKYAEVYDGSDSYSRTNRSTYMSFGYAAMEGHFCICYLDGVHPAVVAECAVRGTNKLHHTYVFSWGYDWTSGKPKNWSHRSTWSQNDKHPGCASFHQIRVADVDGDGLDEMVQGGYSVNPETGKFHTAGIGHGDRHILSDIDPDRPGLEVYAIQQSDLLGQLIYDANTGERIREWFLPSVYDVGRGACMDVDASRKGYEVWSYVDEFFYDCKGNQTGNTRSGTMFEGVWWDGNLQREELSSPGGKGWGTNLMVTQVLSKARLVEFSQESSWATHAATGTRPAFMGDIAGDWREEVILAKQDDNLSTGLVGYTTNMPTTYSIYCLQQDPHYRGDCTTRGYYQHPNTGFYLGGDMPSPQLPPCMTADLVLGAVFGNTGTESVSWAAGSTDFTDYARSTALSYANGKSVLLDLYTPTHILLNEAMSPSVFYAMPVNGQRSVLDGTGCFEGSMELWKSQQGTLVVNVPMKQTGTTYVSEGVLEVNNTISADVELRARGTLAGNPVLKGQLLLEGALNDEGCRLSPGTPTAPFGTITLEQGFTVNKPLFFEANVENLPDEPTGQQQHADRLVVNGDLNVTAPLTLHIIPTDGTLEPGEYLLITFSGAFKGKESNLSVMGLAGLSYHIKVGDGTISLVINEQRQAAEGVAWTGTESTAWDYQALNWLLNDVPTEFVAGDAVQFTDQAVKTTVTLNELMPVSRITVSNDTKDFIFSGTDGGFSGEASLIKEGAGKLTINNTKSTYTGATIITGGTVSVKELADGGKPSSIGAATSAATNWQLGHATLIINNSNIATDRGLTLTDSAIVQVPNGGVTLRGQVMGKGSLTKTGTGQLTLSSANTYTGGTILNSGTLAMGAWNATFGRSGSPIHVTGNATITIFNNNSTSAVPSLGNVITVQKGKTLTINGGQRCDVQGSFLGEGTVKINFPYVRGDFFTDVTHFEGELNPTDGQFRLTAGMNLQKGTLKLGDGVYAVGVKSHSGTETSLTHTIGALSSTASDAQLGTSIWNVGYLGTNTTFAGIIGSNATLNKYGEGVLILTGSSAGKITVYGGTVSLENTTATTTALVTAASGGTVVGAGTTASVTVSRGGTVGAGKATGTTVGTLTITSNLTVQNGGAIRVRGHGTRSVDEFRVSGKVTLVNPLFRMERLIGEWAPDTDYKVLTGTGTITLTGTPTFEPAIPMEGYIWDYNALASDGIIRVVSNPVGIERTTPDLPRIEEEKACEVFDLSGRRVNKASGQGILIVRSPHGGAVKRVKNRLRSSSPNPKGLESGH